MCIRDSYADDCVEYLVQRSVANGIDIIRIFDALNDIKNLKTASLKLRNFKETRIRSANSLDL